VRAADGGQAVLLLLGVMLAVVAGGLVLAAVAAAVSGRAERQRAADLAALGAARAMRAERHRRLAPAVIAGRPNPEHLTLAAYLDLARRAAAATAGRNRATAVEVSFPDGGVAPLRVRVRVGAEQAATGGARAGPVRGAVAAALRSVLRGTASAEAEVVADAAAVTPAGVGGYAGALATRQGKRMRPDVALAFDRLDAAARADGVRLVVASAFRSDAEQARLFAARPDPRWVAPPGTSLHRLGTELDLGPPSAYAWLARNAPRFGFVKRYAWEPWHFGFAPSPGTRSVGFGPPPDAAGLPAFVPARFAPAIRRAASRWGVGAAVLAAQLFAESGFDPHARSPAGALGIAQFMPGAARAYGLHDPFDPAAAIDAQAHHMRDLLRRFGALSLALAAYNAGAGAVARCGCIPPYAETRAYVARILALLGGATSATLGPPVRLVA
jgi:soluble lytic murein transglycosylase-like protein